LNPFKTYLRKGIHWGGGSDYFVTPYPARYGLWASVERQTLKGVYGEHPFAVSEAVDVHAALRSYTSGRPDNFFLKNQGWDNRKRQEADIAVWNRDWYAVPAFELKDMKCEMTIFDGGNRLQSAGHSHYRTSPGTGNTLTLIIDSLRRESAGPTGEG